MTASADVLADAVAGDHGDDWHGSYSRQFADLLALRRPLGVPSDAPPWGLSPLWHLGSDPDSGTEGASSPLGRDRVQVGTPAQTAARTR